MAKTHIIKLAASATLLLWVGFATISIAASTNTKPLQSFWPQDIMRSGDALINMSIAWVLPPYTPSTETEWTPEKITIWTPDETIETPLSWVDTKTILAKKLEEFGRMQEAIKTLEQLDTVDGSWLVLITPQEAAQRAASLWDDITTVISDFEKIQELRKENEERYTIVLNQVKKVILDINITRQSVNDSVLKINIYTKRMVDEITELKRTREYIDNTKTTLTQLLPTVYMLQNEYTNQEGNVDDLKLLLGSGSMWENLSYEDMLAWLSLKLDTLLGDLATAQEKYISSINAMRETRKQLKTVVTAYQDKMQSLEEQKEYLLYFVEVYRNNKIQLDQTITDLFATRADQQRKIDTLISALSKNTTTYTVTNNSWDKIERIWFSISDPNYKNFLNLNDKREWRINFFGWPILPVKQITTYYGDTITVGDTEEVFNGIQTLATQWQEIYAPANGFVYVIQNQDWLGENRMILLHNNGYISVFRNVQKILVKEKTVIKRWQIIGLIGWQPGTRGAWWFSSQAALSMQLYKNGEAVDPLDNLDLSIFNDNMTLATKYRSKHGIDTRLRNSVMKFENLPFVKGDTPQEKRLRFLNDYAKAPYNDLVLWEKAADGTNVDPDLGICIWYAETSLGRAFASANNIGNVGNNDRGDRVDKDSPLDGARAIYTTLNNGYLGGYNTIFELSGYGNQEGAIYASSEYNWQNNVSRCLSIIKWYVVPEDYPFRTYREN